MQVAPGCFGSMIAYDRKSEACKPCCARVSCELEVEKVRPRIIALLDKVGARDGREMSHAWLTRTERKARKEAIVDESLITQGLTLGLADTRANTIIKRAAKQGVNPRTCSRGDLRGLSRHVDTVVSLLESAPATRDDIAADMQERARMTHQSAQRTAAVIISFLTSIDRAAYRGNHLELL